METFVPKISVIIPMYNAEKYVAECLESILSQTFTNFEVIVVDDCSTDSSCVIVENCRERFGGRLILSHMEKNTGSGALPRNKGVALSRGEYLFFVDADDLITPTALEELYTLAKDYDADIVHCGACFETDEKLSKVRVKSYEAEQFFVDKPTLETENLLERIKILTSDKYWMPTWINLIRRNLAVEYGIKFPPVSISEDVLWFYEMFFYAKKILRVPNIVYFYRQSKSSVIRVNKTLKQYIIFWLNPILLGLQTLEKVLGKHEFFRQNPQYLYQVLEIFIDKACPPINNTTFDLPPFSFYEVIKEEFGEKLGEHTVLISLLYTKLNTLQLENADNVKNFCEFAEAANKRIAELEAELQRLKS